MEIVVCIKGVCVNPVHFVLSEAGDKIDCGSRTLVMNEIDEYAVEQAAVMKKELGGSVTVITVGDLASQDVLFVAKAKGADRIIRVAADPSTPMEVSQYLADVISNLHFDLVLTGVESSDAMTGQTGICLAENLGLPFAYAVSAIEVNSNCDVIRIRKELGGGVYQELEIRLPALLCVQSGIQQLKYTAPAKVIRARNEPPEVYATPDKVAWTNTEDQPFHIKLVSLFKPESGRNAEYIEGKPGEIAHKVIQNILEVS